MDCIVSDYAMPGTDGIDTIAVIEGAHSDLHRPITVVDSIAEQVPEGLSQSGVVRSDTPRCRRVRPTNPG